MSEAFLVDVSIVKLRFLNQKGVHNNVSPTENPANESPHVIWQGYFCSRTKACPEFSGPMAGFW